MGKIYYLDLNTVMETLEGQSGLLQRELLKEQSTLNEPALCTIQVIQGKIARCTLVTRNGQQFDAGQLLPTLATLEKWDVTLTPLTPLAPQQKTATLSPVLPQHTGPQSSREAANEAPFPPSEAELIPYLVIEVGIEQLAQFSHKDRILVRTVLAQINGTRSIAEIRARLTLSRNVVNQVLDVLSQRSFIRFYKRSER